MRVVDNSRSRRGKAAGKAQGNKTTMHNQEPQFFMAH